MRTLLAGPVTPLLGSLGLHGCALLLVILGVRHPVQLSLVAPNNAAADNALEVDAIATPDALPSIPNTESPEAADPAAPAQAVTQPEPALAAPPAPTSAVKAEITIPPAAPPMPKRVPRVPRRVQPTAAQDSAASSAVEGTDKPNTPAATGAFGSTELPPGVRSLPSAFTRAIPPATGADPLWQTLPVGTQRPFSIALHVDADGHIADSKILEDHTGNPPPEQFVHLRERVVAMLGAGLFALQDHVGAGYDVFRITVTLSDRAVTNEDEPAQLVERGFDPPREGQAGRAYFTLASGRHFVAKVEVLNAQHAHP